MPSASRPTKPLSALLDPAGSLDRAVFHGALQNFFPSFVNLPVSLVTEKDGLEDWTSLVQSNQRPNLVQFEGYQGKLEARKNYHLPWLAQVRKRGSAVVGSYAGAHDAFVPVLHKGRVEGVLVSGSFFKAQLSAEAIRANFHELTGLRPDANKALLQEYARTATETPVLEPAVLRGFLGALGACAAYLGGECSGVQTAAALKKLQHDLFGRKYPWRSWAFVASRRDRRFYEFYVQPKLMPWDKVELGMERHPSIALAVSLLREPGQAIDEVEEIATNAALQRAVFRLVPGLLPGSVAGRMDSTAAYILTSPEPKSSAAKARLRIKEQANALAAELRREFRRPVAVGISPVDRPAEELPEAMNEAAVALHLCARTNRNMVLFDEHALDAQGSGPSRLMARLDALRDAYSRALQEEASLAADEFVADVLMQSRQSAEVMRIHFLYAFHALDEQLKRRALLPAHRMEQFTQQWVSRFDAEGSSQGLMSVFREMLRALLGLITSPGEGDRLLRLEQARRYLDQHCLEPIGIREVAKIGGFSPSRFSRLFRKAEGLGFAEYLLKRRLDKARYLLLHSQLPVQQVAIEAGFSSLSYFSQAFKKATGSNPRRFRANEHAS